ncbi:MAG: hypothetical protein ACJAZN_002751, partial [Planctomycetota bacterium]
MSTLAASSRASMRVNQRAVNSKAAARILGSA